MAAFILPQYFWLWGDEVGVVRSVASVDTGLFSKGQDYYANARTDIVHLVPEGSGRVLEVGCGSGNTLRALRDQGRGSRFEGIEIDPISIDKARETADRIWFGTVEDVLDEATGFCEQAPFDTILCLDILEHLVDPWKITRDLAERLVSGGTMIASIPNVRFYRVVLDLLLKGEWQYQESGVLDSTHLRFFTRKTAIKLLEQAGLTITSIKPTTVFKPWKNKWIINKLAGGRLEDIYSYNYLISAKKTLA